MTVLHCQTSSQHRLHHLQVPQTLQLVYLLAHLHLIKDRCLLKHLLQLRSGERAEKENLAQKEGETCSLSKSPNESQVCRSSGFGLHIALIGTADVKFAHFILVSLISFLCRSTKEIRYFTCYTSVIKKFILV